MHDSCDTRCLTSGQGPAARPLAALVLATVLFFSACSDTPDYATDDPTDDRTDSTTSASTDPEPPATTMPENDSASTEPSSPEATESENISASASAVPSTSASPDPSTAPAGSMLEGAYLGMRSTAGMSPSLSMECYSFATDGTVELRHSGATSPSDTGTYRIGMNGWEVSWSSGRTSYVAPTARGLLIDSLEVTPIDDCLVPQ